MSAIRSASSSTTWAMSSRRKRLAIEQVDEAARRGHDDLGALLEHPGLLLERRAAVDDGEALARGLAERRQDVVDLDAQLAGRHHHQGGGRLRFGHRGELQERAVRRRGSCRNRSWPCRTRRGRRGHRRW